MGVCQGRKGEEKGALDNTFAFLPSLGREKRAEREGGGNNEWESVRKEYFGGGRKRKTQGSNRREAPVRPSRLISILGPGRGKLRPGEAGTLREPNSWKTIAEGRKKGEKEKESLCYSSGAWELERV